MFEKIRDIVVNGLFIDDEEFIAGLSDKTRFTEDLCADSLDMVDIVMDIEDEFNTSIEDEVFHTIVTLGDLVRAVEDAVGQIR